MARSRNIKPGFFMNDELAEIDPLGRILFAGLWCIADREGRLEDRPKRIKAEVLPYDDCDVNDLLDQLAKHDFIIRYGVDGERYIQVSNFSKHQNPHKNEATSIIPAPDKSSTSTVQAPEQTKDDATIKADITGSPTSSGTSTVQVPDKHNTNPADSLNMIPDSLNMIDDHYNQKGNRADDFKPEQIESSSRGREIYQSFENEFGRLLSPFEVDTLKSWLNDFSEELIIHALKVAVLGQNRSFRYIQGILTRWKGEGVKCVQDVEILEQRHQAEKRRRAGPEKKKSIADQNAQVLEAVFGAEP